MSDESAELHGIQAPSGPVSTSGLMVSVVWSSNFACIGSTLSGSVYVAIDTSGGGAGKSSLGYSD